MITIPGMYKLTSRQFGLYVILTDPVTGYETCAAAAVQAKVRYLQLRIKNRPVTEFMKVAEDLRRLTRGTETRLIINDSLEVAMAVDADGLHLGQNDMPLPEARARWGQTGKIFGLSTHNPEQARAALDLNPDYIGVGPVFPTPTKAIPDPVLGVETMSGIIKATPLPAVAIGGINRENLKQVLAGGAVNFSAVRPITSSQSPLEVIRELQTIWAAALNS